MFTRLSSLLALTSLCVALSVPTAAQVRTRAARARVPARPPVTTVVVEGLRNDRGIVLGALYRSAERWLVADHADVDCRAPIVHGRAECVFTNLAPGPMAFAAVHDEDGDGQLGRDLLGLPSEGYAFSNDAREPLGPPSFEAASFRPGTLVVHARYGL
jgi:uncharacterized protein (DUF2141 family)